MLEIGLSSSSASRADEWRGADGVIRGGQRGWNGTGMTGNLPGRDVGRATEGFAMDQYLGEQTVD